MTITAIKDFRIKESYAKLIEKALFSYLWEGIYKPMFEIMAIKQPKAVNSFSVIAEALREGKIYYVEGGFKAKDKFNNAQSRELEKWGAKWDKWEKMYKIPREQLPQEISVTLAEAQVQNELKINLIDEFLKEVQNNIPYIVESMVFNEEVVTILDDAGKEIQKNVKHLNIIEPELSEAQKQEIARAYTENVRQYVIKDFGNERIPEMRRKVQEIVLQGYRPDKVQELLEKEYGIASRKAKFLAQNETSIMLAEYKKSTYKEIGFDKFIWKTIIDGRERDRHHELDGQIFSYDNPPYVDAGKTRRGLPGEDFNCRCTAIPFTEGNPFIKTEVRDGKLRLAKNSSDEVDWITVKGNHIPIKKGQTKEEAVKEFIKSKTTIAGVTKGKPMSYHKANGGRVNPNYKKGGGYDMNCQTCVAVFEARLRGYDIEAVPYDKANKAMRELSKRPWKAYKTRFGDYPKETSIKVSNTKDCEKWLKDNIKLGQRYAFAYENFGEGSGGHIIEVKKGLFNSLQFYDPQSGKHLSARDALSAVCFNKVSKGIRYRYYPMTFRVDNAEIDTELMSEILDYK